MFGSASRSFQSSRSAHFTGCAKRLRGSCRGSGDLGTRARGGSHGIDRPRGGSRLGYGTEPL